MVSTNNKQMVGEARPENIPFHSEERKHVALRVVQTLITQPDVFLFLDQRLQLRSALQTLLNACYIDGTRTLIVDDVSLLLAK
jgi:hypothetical protein